MESTPDSKIVELIRKCLALAESSNENEAAAAAAKAQDLLLKYNLEIADVLASDPEAKSIPVVEQRYYFKYAHSKWKLQLAANVGKTNFCKVIWLGTRGFIYIGRKHNVESAMEIDLWIVEQLFTLAAERTKQNKWKSSQRSSYLIGASQIVSDRLLEQHKLNMQPVTQSTALVLVDDKAIKHFVSDAYPRLTTSRMGWGNGKDYNAYSQGRDDGRDVHIGNRPKKLEQIRSLPAGV